MTDEMILVPRAELLAWAKAWLNDYDPNDGTDCVTPFDTYLLKSPADAHCTTCSCVPGMTPAIRFDTTPAEKEGEVRDHLIRMGWTPPAEVQPVGEAGSLPGSNGGFTTAVFKASDVPVGTKLYTAPPSAPVGVEWVMELADEYDTKGKHEQAYDLRALAQQPGAKPTNRAESSSKLVDAQPAAEAQAQGGGEAQPFCRECGTRSTRHNPITVDLCARCAQRGTTPAPIGWVFQHDETGRMTFCENDGVNTPDVFARLNPRHTLCGPAFTTPPSAPVGVSPPSSVVWHPIETAPKDNKHPLYLAQFDHDTGELIELDWDAAWEAESESWEIPQVYYIWRSAYDRVGEPTHWAYQNASIQQPAADRLAESLSHARENAAYLGTGEVVLQLDGAEWMTKAEEALAQQPAPTLPDVDDDDLTVAYMAGRHDGRKEAQQPAAVDGALEEAVRALAKEWRADIEASDMSARADRRNTKPKHFLRDLEKLLKRHGGQRDAQQPAADFDAWRQNPYTKLLMKSIDEDFVPKHVQQPAAVDGDWRKKAAEWLEAKAVEQEAANQKWPSHAACYKEWRDRPGILRHLAIQVLAAQQEGYDNDR